MILRKGKPCYNLNNAFKSNGQLVIFCTTGHNIHITTKWKASRCLLIYCSSKHKHKTHVTFKHIVSSPLLCLCRNGNLSTLIIAIGCMAKGKAWFGDAKCVEKSLYPWKQTGHEAKPCLTHWPLGDLDAILKLQFSISFYWLVSSHHPKVMPWDECHGTSQVISQHWFR